LFRANCLFRNFEIKGPADRTLIYGILFISDCLNKLGSRPSQNQQEATKTLNALALENFNIPGEPGFPLNPLYAPPANRNDAGTSYSLWMELTVELLRQYLSQFRQEVAQRLIVKVYADNPAAPSKWWMSFKKRLFMNKSLS
jgi:actin related protein 2/3 complex, subunit 3